MCVCVCVCVCVWNKLEVCTTLAYPHISSFRTMPVLHTSTRHTRVLKPFEDSEPTGLKADIARAVGDRGAQDGHPDFHTAPELCSTAIVTRFAMREKKRVPCQSKCPLPRRVFNCTYLLVGSATYSGTPCTTEQQQQQFGSVQFNSRWYPCARKKARTRSTPRLTDVSAKSPFK